MIVIGGSSSVGLARDVAKLLGCEFIQASTTRFPDGECYTRLDRESIDSDAVIIQNTYPDGNLIEMLLIRDAAITLGAKRITMVIPYFGYARQDRLFKPGEPMSARVMCDILDRICDKVITIDLHKESTLDNFTHAHKDLKAAGPSPSTSGAKGSTWSCPLTSVLPHALRTSETVSECPTTIWRRPGCPAPRSASLPPRPTAPERGSSSWTT